MLEKVGGEFGKVGWAGCSRQEPRLCISHKEGTMNELQAEGPARLYFRDVSERTMEGLLL